MLANIVIKNRQILTYGVIGCICVGIDFSIFTILSVKLHLDYVQANIISVHCGIISSFLLNRHFTFGIKDKIAIRFFVFYLIGLLGLLISSLLLMFLIEYLHLNKLVSKAVTVVVVALVQFVMNKLITFKK